jgi:hypothetical protein
MNSRTPESKYSCLCLLVCVIVVYGLFVQSCFLSWLITQLFFYRVIEFTSSSESVCIKCCWCRLESPKPHLFKSSTKSSFEVSSQPLSGHPMLGPVVNLPLTCLPSKRGWLTAKELAAHPNALLNDLWHCLWRHSDCYDLRKVWMMLKGKVLVVQLNTRKHRDETLVAHLSLHNFKIWSTKCNGTSCMPFPFQVLSFAMIHF